ncbi:uncharacterized protein BO72DRAFT_495607 [Aspergillus fijiensis CBS 313.89]|uniref:Cyclochlorotine biosynthesis protein O n=1 Tax=Aspergillus fijiensis CBS 313.89 TaxID=1448319 RepID=A0A8G1RSI2_9EURO|nr:uncharacterized protein BO72DRAFT_495607 [Aspergillus fijiensis CBS 313.89]RAK78074.1 hypothetical protein BO72DRAFT_495607 [Aspergillus fijiensis CBS 313.89]
METESQPFLTPTATDGDQQQQKGWWHQVQHTCKSSFSKPIALWIGVPVLINAFVLISLTSWVAHQLRGLQRHFVPTKFTDYSQTAYFQDPGSLADAAWEDLLGDMFIRVSTEELDLANQTSISLPRDDKHLAWLGVYHDLHCIVQPPFLLPYPIKNLHDELYWKSCTYSGLKNTLRQWIHRDYYHPNLTAAEQNKLESHISHCLDMLRQSVQCHADAYLMTFRWTETQQKPEFNPAMPVRTCVDFALLRRSLQPRSVELEEIQGLENPLMGKEI